MLCLVRMEKSVFFLRIEGNVADQGRASFKRFSQSPSLSFFPPGGFRNTSNWEREGI
jgi:hypothetical protein